MLYNTNKITSAITLILVLSLALVSFPEIKPVKAQSKFYLREIHIRADGTVEGTDKIQRDGDIYTFTGDIGADIWSYGIKVERDNIVIDGAGFLLKGHGQFHFVDIFYSGYPIINGISLDGRNNVTIKNLHMWGFMNGFFGSSCTNIKILGNNMTNVATNMMLNRFSHSIISGNTINSGNGIVFIHGSNNTVEGNYWDDYAGVDNDGDGIGDTPYIIDENNQDNHPLMEPHIIPEFSSWAPIVITFFVLAVVLVLYRKEITSKSTST